MFKKRERPAAARHRNDDGDGETGTVPLATKKSRHPVATSTDGGSEGHIVASTRKSLASEAQTQADFDADTALHGWKANDGANVTAAQDAVRTHEIDTEVGKDTRAMHERNQEIHKGLKDGTLEPGIYRGLGGYKQYAERSDSAISASKFTGLLGPLRGNQYARQTMRVEFWNSSSGTDGGICKDYKETGYCGWGDSCKYAHDRSDYKSGFQLEKEWETKQKAIEEKARKRWERRQRRLNRDVEAGEVADKGADSDVSSKNSDDDELPVGCPACRTNWEDCKSIPIQTICGHYFCEDCAMESFARTPKCMACDAATNGIFNSCDAIDQKIKAKKAAKASKVAAEAQKRNRADPHNISLED